MDIPQEDLQGNKILDANWPFRGQIEFQNVTLRYMPSLPPALHGLSLKIVGGTQVCKSSHINAMLCVPTYLTRLGLKYTAH